MLYGLRATSLPLTKDYYYYYITSILWPSGYGSAVHEGIINVSPESDGDSLTTSSCHPRNSSGQMSPEHHGLDAVSPHLAIV